MRFVPPSANHSAWSDVIRCVYGDEYAPVSAIDHEQATVVADLDAVNGVELVRSWVLRILRRRSPVHQELAVLVELGDARAAVAVADEARAVGQPCDVGGPIEQTAAVAPALTLRAPLLHQLPVVGELVNLVELVVDDPDVLLGIVGAHLDLVRPAPALALEHRVLIVPPLDHLAVAIDDEDGVVVPPFPSAL